MQRPGGRKNLGMGDLGKDLCDRDGERDRPGLWGRQGQVRLCLPHLGFSLRKLGSLWRALSSQRAQYDLGFKVLREKVWRVNYSGSRMEEAGRRWLGNHCWSSNEKRWLGPKGWP